MARLSSPVSMLDPSSRIVCLAFLSSTALLAPWPFAAALALSASILLRLGGVAPRAILGESVFVLSFAVLAAALRLVAAGFRVEPMALAADTAAYGLRLAAAFLMGRLLYASTRVSELRDAATRIARRIGLPRSFDLGIYLSLVLGFVPLVFEEWTASLEAARSRGMPRRPSLAMQAKFLAAYLRRLMIRAAALPEVLIARGYSRDRGLSASRWSTIDTIAVACSGMALVLALLPRA